MDNALYDYSPIVTRPRLDWPNAARVAFYVGVNIEHYEIDKPSTSIFAGTAKLKPDPLNYGWRDYGVRVGIWRMIEALDRYGLRASVLLNADVCARYPQIIDAGRARDWAWVAHGRNNSIFQADMTIEQERAYLAEVVATITAATGKRITGWMGPALTETFETPGLLKELGLSYVLDWCADDQPFPLNVPGMISVPYSVELNDVMLFTGHGLSGEEFYRTVVDQFDQLYRDAEQGGRVMALCLHPFVINQPFRHKYLEKALAYIAGHEGVWLTTSDDIAAHYAAEVQKD
ncbi:polysaccharide deacetylase family protein [Sphingomonas sp. So64.6b]|uniref:polysaccharide deacetylase family protein n=1 Tax=Sphingomonas sp. So64.6b TaxID=2997354 RepID=UPI00160434D6|nr:polysaccharide deacetylase family protein [Sphingomonas sp. So64.6b]QNA85876.1 polysaccharide deacetylase family protein [Sphingomonas sp. So64.6b]